MDDVQAVLESALQREQFPIGERRQFKLDMGEVVDCPFYHLVPKGKATNAAWRSSCREMAASSKEFRLALTEASSRDILFFANTLLQIFEPRTAATLPFNTWRDQDHYILWMDEAFGKRDCGCEKSRGLGFSWLICLLCYYHWCFDAYCQIGLVSRTEAAVDTMDDPDCLMWKLDFLHKQTPEWFRGEKLNRTYGDHRFHNKDNNSSVIGYEATGNVMTGGRKRAIFMDEFGKFDARQQQSALNSVQHVSNCRYFVSTFKGSHTKFFAMMRREESSMLKLVADWRDNPERAKGSYRVVEGKVEILDQDYSFPPGYKFVTEGPFFKEGGIRSPWYDFECQRTGATPASIAEELDREPEAPGSSLFSEAILNKALRETVMEPTGVGHLDFDPREYEPLWMLNKGGNAKLWRPTDSQGTLSHGGPYALGCDIAVGSGTELSSFSVLQVIDIQTKEQVMEISSNTIPPVQFAQMAYSVCKWLCKDRGPSWAYLNWESNGIGSVFTREIKRLNWPNKYVAEVPTHMLKKKTMRLGWHNADGGEVILSEMQRAIAQGELIVRSEDVIEDCRHYKRDDKGKVIHSGVLIEGAQPARSHGDRSCALAIAWLAARDRPAPDADIIEKERQAHFEAQRREPQPAASVTEVWDELEPLMGVLG